MRQRRHLVPSLLFFLFFLFFAAVRAGAQTIPIDVEAGFRFLDVSGNRDMYRSQIDERQGFLLRSLTVSAAEPEGSGILFDRLSFAATDIGVGPAGGFRLELSRSDLYRLRTTYQRTELFSALPAFANPFLDAGIVPGQHTYDRERHRFDADFELFPGASITPLFGYSRNSYSGPGSTTYRIGQDEFRLTQDLSDLDQEVRAGASFQAGAFSGRILQGWRKLHSEETLTLAPGAGSGNNAAPVLGVPELATGFTRSTTTDVNTPATSAFVTGRLGPRVRVVGSYARAKGSSDTDEQENLAGDFVSFEISRIFHGLTELVASRATAVQWSGLGRVEVAVTDFLDFETSYTRRHRELDGYALVSSLYLATSTFTGVSTGDLARLLEARTSLDRTDTIYEASLSARRLGPFSIRGGYSRTDEDLTISADPSEILVPGGQGGEFSRRVNSWNVAVAYSASGVTAGADYRGDRANDAVVRTDFRRRDRYRLRAAWAWKELVRVSATAEQTDISNDDPSIALDGRIRRYGGDVDVSPWKPLHVRLSAAKYQADNTALIRQPQDFTIISSVHREDGTSYEGSLVLTIPRLDLQAGYGHFRNDGVFPFTIERIRLTAEVPVASGFSGVGEWSRDDYSERSGTAPNLGNFVANRYGVFLRWHL